MITQSVLEMPSFICCMKIKQADKGYNSATYGHSNGQYLYQQSQHCVWFPAYTFLQQGIVGQEAGQSGQSGHFSFGHPCRHKLQYIGEMACG